jgi:predicted transcriptional regulator
MVNDMTALSLRLPDDIDALLGEEARVEGKTRSEIARTAISDYLARREKERFMAEMVEEARRAYASPEIRRESLEIANDLVDEGLDAIIADEIAAGINPDEIWWKP